MKKLTYIVLEKTNCPASDGFGDADIQECSFHTIKAAKDWIRKDVLETFSPDSIHDDFGDFCSRYVICEIVSVVNPVPSVAVSVRLRDET